MDNTGNEVNVFPALSAGPKFGISQSALETNDLLFLLPITGQIVVFITIVLSFFFFIFLQFTLYDGQLLTSFGDFFVTAYVSNICKQLTSLLLSNVTCLSP